MKSIYQCEYCGNIFNFKDLCENCEDSHKKHIFTYLCMNDSSKYEEVNTKERIIYCPKCAAIMNPGGIK